MGFLYKLDFLSGKSYIGITDKESMSRRLNCHRCEARHNRSDYAVHRAWRKYGEPLVTVLAVATGRVLLDLEKWAVALYGTYGDGGYNMTPGGEKGTCTPEAREKLRIAMTGRVRSLESRARQSASTKGKLRGPLSDEHKAKMSAVAKQRKYSPETRAKMRAARLGMVYPPDVCAKISASLKGKIVSVETRKKLSAAAKLRMSDPAVRARLSALGRLRKCSPETRAKISAATKGVPKCKRR